MEVQVIGTGSKGSPAPCILLSPRHKGCVFYRCSKHARVGGMGHLCANRVWCGTLFFQPTYCTDRLSADLRTVYLLRPASFFRLRCTIQHGVSTRRANNQLIMLHVCVLHLPSSPVSVFHPPQTNPIRRHAATPNSCIFSTCQRLCRGLRSNTGCSAPRAGSLRPSSGVARTTTGLPGWEGGSCEAGRTAQQNATLLARRGLLVSVPIQGRGEKKTPPQKTKHKPAAPVASSSATLT